MRCQPAAERIDAGDRLRDQPVRAGRGDALAMLAHRICGQRDDRHLAARIAAGADRADHVEAGEPRHLDVDDDEVDRLALEALERLDAVGADGHPALSERSICDATIWLVGLSSARRTCRPARSGAGDVAPCSGGQRSGRDAQHRCLRATATGGWRAASRRPARSASDRTILSPRPSPERSAVTGRRCGREAGAVVGHPQDHRPVGVLRDRQAHRSRLAELDRVADQVVGDPRQREQVEPQALRHARLRLDLEHEAALARLAAVATAHVPQEARRHRPALSRPGRDRRPAPRRPAPAGSGPPPRPGRPARASARPAPPHRSGRRRRSHPAARRGYRGAASPGRAPPAAARPRRRGPSRGKGR